MKHGSFKDTVKYGRYAASAIAVSLLLSAGSANAGALFVTGHDSDEHNNGAYMAAGLDFLMFGTASTAPARAGKSIAYIGTDQGSTPSSLSGTGYSSVTYIDADSSAAVSGALGGSFDAIMIGSGAGNPTQRANLVANTAAFTTYFNNDGALFIHTDEGFGQAWYDFVPNFGTTANNTISTSGAFDPTVEGLAIGLTNAIVDADITHSFYTGVDETLFTVFERQDPALFGGSTNPVAFGASDLVIGGGGEFESVSEPGSLALVGIGIAGIAGIAAIRRRRRVS
ncbi:MAG: hypothetical protein ACI9JL_001431 [Paracoccaceae bacterium]|jgi:hypothetical protein